MVDLDMVILTDHHLVTDTTMEINLKNLKDMVTPMVRKRIKSKRKKDHILMNTHKLRIRKNNNKKKRPKTKTKANTVCLYILYNN
jgi:hypothetical protein